VTRNKEGTRSEVKREIKEGEESEPMKVYGLTGLPGSGKSELGTIAKNHNYPIVRMGDMVWDYVRDHGHDLKPGIVGKMAHERREKEGADIWAKVTADHIRKLILDQEDSEKSSPKFVIIDGIRSHFEVERFRQEFKDFSIVAVHTSPATRYRRILARKRVDDTLSYEAFIERENREFGWGIAQVIAQADIMIVNEGSLNDLQESVELLFS